MNESIELLFSTVFILMALGTSAIVYAVDLVVRYVFSRFGKEAGKNKAYKDLVLPLLPLVVGGVLGYFGEGIVFGVVAGLLSGLIWRVVKSVIKSKIVVNQN